MASGSPACARMERITERPRGARLPGTSAVSISSILDSPSLSARTALAEIAGTLETPDSAKQPASIAASLSAAMPAVKAASSEKSR